MNTKQIVLFFVFLDFVALSVWVFVQMGLVEPWTWLFSTPAGLQVSAAYQEHGVITGEFDFDDLPIGTRLRILPNHACLTCAQFDRYHVHSDSQVVAVWDRIREWV